MAAQGFKFKRASGFRRCSTVVFYCDGWRFLDLGLRIGVVQEYFGKVSWEPNEGSSIIRLGCWVYIIL